MIPFIDDLLPGARAQTGAEGTARFATLGALRRAGRLSQRGHRGGLYVGTVPGVLRRHAVLLPDQHSISGVLLAAPPNSGKTTRLVIPQVLTAVGQDRTLIINDPSLEIMRATAPLLSLTHQIGLWAPLYAGLYGAGDDTILRRFDPLQHVRSGEDARAIAKSIIDTTGRSTQQGFHDRIEEDLITVALIYHRVAVPHATIQDVRRFLLRAQMDDLMDALSWVLSHADNEMVADVYGTLDRLADSLETRGDVLAGLGGRFGSLASRAVCATTRGDDIAVAELTARPSVLYVSIPLEDSGIGTLRPLINIFFTTLVRELQALGGVNPLPRPVHLYLEEAANIGKLDGMPTLVRTGRKKGIVVVTVVQGFSDIVGLYGADDAASIRGACTVQATLGGAAQDDADYFARRAGDTSRRLKQPTRRGRGFFPGAPQSTTLTTVKRPLITADEVRRLHEEALVIENAEDPIKTSVPPYYANTQVTRALAQALASLPTRAPALAAVLARIDRGDLKEPDLLTTLPARPAASNQQPPPALPPAGSTAGSTAGGDDADPYVVTGVLQGYAPDAASPDGTPPLVGVLRCGGRRFHLDPAIMPLLVQAIAPRPRAELIAWARAQAIADPADLLDALVERGFLARVGGESAVALTTLQHLRLHPLGLGLGAAEDDPAVYDIADGRGEILLRCSAALYLVWSASDGRSIGAASTEAAQLAGLSVDDVVRHLAQNLAALLASGAAVLDQAAVRNE